MDMTTPAKAKLLPLGIHFGLDEDLHHADPGLGSTDLRRLHNDATSYWYESHMNPHRPTRNSSTPSQLRGRAMHKLLYEGEALFDKLYMRGPDQDGMSTAEKTATTKAANAKAAALGKDCLKAPDYDQIAMAAAMITKNPSLAGVFRDGFSEVSIFWQRDGVRLKARLDYLKARGVGDLKSVANERDVDFRKACVTAVANYRYDIQACHYLEARAQVGVMVKAGAIFGQPRSVEHAQLLAKIAEATEFGWQWIFYQSEGAPITWSRTLTPERVDPKTGEVKLGNPLLAVARDHIEAAIARYKLNLERFGESMWLLIEEPRELFQEDMPGWFGR